MSTASEMIGRLKEKMHQGAAVPLVHGKIADEKDSIRWIPKQGLYADVTLVTDPFGGETCPGAIVGGDIYWAARGALRNRPLAAGDHVLLALVDGTADGHAIIISRIATTESNPADEIAFAEVNLENLLTTAFDLFRPGESWHVAFQDGDLHLLFQGKANMVFRMPDGATLAYGDGKGWKVRDGKGALMMVADGTCQLRSPSGKSYLEITDEGVFVHGEVFKVSSAKVMLGVDPADSAKIGTKGAMVGGPPAGLAPVPPEAPVVSATVPGPLSASIPFQASISSRVFIGG